MSSKKFLQHLSHLQGGYLANAEDAVLQVLNDPEEVDEAVLTQTRTEFTAKLVAKLNDLGLLSDADIIELLGPNWSLVQEQDPCV